MIGILKLKDGQFHNEGRIWIYPKDETERKIEEVEAALNGWKTFTIEFNVEEEIKPR